MSSLTTARKTNPDDLSREPSRCPDVTSARHALRCDLPHSEYDGDGELTTPVVTLATDWYSSLVTSEHRHSARQPIASAQSGQAARELDPVTRRRNASGLARDLEIVELLGTVPADQGMGVSQLAAQSGRDKAVVSRALSTLLDAGIVSRDADTLQYRIGPRVFALAARSIEANLVTTARPILRRLTQTTKETSHLCVLREGNVLTLASELSPHEVRTTGWQGVTTAAWRTPSGRALLSEWDDTSLRSWYKIHGHDRPVMSQLDPEMAASGFSVLATPASDKIVVHDFESFRTELVHIRATGYAVLDEELEAGVVGTSAPVRDFTGSIVAAINVSAPKTRMAGRLDELGAYVARAAAGLSQRLGAPNPPEAPPMNVAKA